MRGDTHTRSVEWAEEPNKVDKVGEDEQLQQMSALEDEEQQEDAQEEMTKSCLNPFTLEKS